LGVNRACAAASRRELELLLVIFAGWVNRHQLHMIEYLQEANGVLKEHLTETSNFLGQRAE
jgi:hypothetical protein